MDDDHFPAAPRRLNEVVWKGLDDTRYLVEKPVDISSPFLTKAKFCMIGELRCNPSELDLTADALPTTAAGMLKLTHNIELIRCDDMAYAPLWTSGLRALDNICKAALIVGASPPSSLIESNTLKLSHTLFTVSIDECFKNRHLYRILYSRDTSTPTYHTKTISR